MSRPVTPCRSVRTEEILIAASLNYRTSLQLRSLNGYDGGRPL